MKVRIIIFAAMVTISSSMALPAAATLVTYDFDSPDISNTITFTGSFDFDTTVHAISNATLVSTGAAPAEIWTRSDPPGTYDSASFDSFDLVFRSPSAAFPVATNPGSEGDIFAISFSSSLDGSTPSDFVGEYELTLGFTQANGVTIHLIGNDLVEGCAAPGSTACAAPAAVPEPSSLTLIGASLAMLIFLHSIVRKPFLA